MEDDEDEDDKSEQDPFEESTWSLNCLQDAGTQDDEPTTADNLGDVDAGFTIPPAAGPETGVYSIRNLSKLTDLAISKHALFGSASYATRSAATSERTTSPSLAEVLPDCLANLTITLDSPRVSLTEAEAFLNDPRAASLEDLILVGCYWDHWWSKKHGEKPSDSISAEEN